LKCQTPHIINVSNNYRKWLIKKGQLTQNKRELYYKESHTLILNNIARFIDLTELEKQKYLSLLTEIKVKKKAFLMQASDVTKYEYFITKGCLKVYT